MTTYKIYVDGSVDANRKAAASAYIAFTDKIYVSTNYKCLSGSNPAHAETIAIGLACRDFLNNESLNLDKDCEVIFFVDCLSAITFMKEKLKDNSPVIGKQSIKSAVKDIRTLNAICKVSFQKAHAHKFEHSCNKYVDALAKYALRSGECMQ